MMQHHGIGRALCALAAVVTLASTVPAHAQKGRQGTTNAPANAPADAPAQ